MLRRFHSVILLPVLGTILAITVSHGQISTGTLQEKSDDSASPALGS